MTILPLEATLGWTRAISATATSLFGGLGVLALVLAAVGTYGVVAYAAAGRAREMGIRRALGAGRRDVLRLVLGRTMPPVVIGAVAGLAGALLVSRVLTSVLVGVSPVDATGIGGAVTVVATVALVTALAASRPAMRAEPTVILRGE